MAERSLTIAGPGWLDGQSNPLRILFSARLWKSAAFLALSFPVGALWFCLLTGLIALGVGAAMIWIGIAVLALAMWLWIGAAQVERWRVATFLGEALPSPYRPLPAGSLLAWTWARAGDAAVWKDLLYLLLLFPLGILEGAIVAAVLAITAGAWLVPAGAVAVSGYYLVLGPGHTLVPPLATPTLFQSLVFALAGLLALLSGQYLVLGAAHVHRALARALLGPAGGCGQR